MRGTQFEIMVSRSLVLLIIAIIGLVSCGRVGLNRAQGAEIEPMKIETIGQCKVMCQRFAMEAMGPEFKGITHPNECVKKCDQVFASVN
ncbi:hypothetical protein AAMO2058_000067400 [Amorphochlora amoebiformis]